MEFWVLESPKPDSNEDRLGKLDVMKPEKGVNRGPAPECPRCARPLGGLTWLPPYRLEIETWGRKWGDIARSSNDLIVSERFKETFEKGRLKGLQEFEAVEVVKVIHRRGRPREPMPGYFKATVARSATAIDQEASGYVWEDASRICPECLFDKLADLRRCKRLVVKQETWNGDDVFFPRGGTRVMVSQRFRSMFHNRELVGGIFIPSESADAGYDSFPWETAANHG